MLSLQRLVSLSNGQLPQQVVDDLVAKANGGEAPVGTDDSDEETDETAESAPVAWQREVVVVIGVGGMGELIARRQGSGKKVLLADFNEQSLERVSALLGVDGFDIHVHQVDVSNQESVAALARAAAELGPVSQVVHTAGLSPAQASTPAIIGVDLVGVALVLEEFSHIVSPGGAGIVISSMAGYGVELPAEVAAHLATSPVDELIDLPEVKALTDPGSAYSFAKRANQLRVQAASVAWGARGARINSISPGVISTPMGQQELDGEYGDVMRAMVAGSGSGRLGTPSDIADAAAFLLGPTSAFITGIDLLVDGGVTASQRA